MKRLTPQDHQALKSLLQHKGLLNQPATAPAVRSEDKRWPAGSAVRRLWLQEGLEGDARINALGLYLRFAHPYPAAQLEQALQTLTARHETLRTHYEVADDQLYATTASTRPVRPGPAIQAPDLDQLQHLLSTHCPSMTASECWQVFPVIDAPPASATACQGMVWLMHHAVCDWFGLQVLIRELLALLDGEALPDRPALQARDFAALEAQRPAARTDTLQTYWRERLKAAPTLFSPPVSLWSTSRPPASSAGCERHTLDFGPALAKTILERCRRHRTTPYFFFLTALTRVLQRLTQDEELLIASTLAHRDRPGADSMAACLSDLIPLRCSPPPQATFAAALRHIQAQVTQDMAHAELGLADIIAAVQPERRPGKAPLAQVMFNLLPAFPLPGVELTPAPLPVARADLVLEILQHQGYSAHFECRPGLFPEGFGQVLAEVWAQTLQQGLAAMADPQQAAPPTHPPTPACPPEAPRLPVRNAIELFLQQAARNPQACALILGEHSISYAGLADQVDRLAARLQQHPAFAPGCKLAVWLPRSVELVVTMLACLKTGAVMMLLDPAHPAERQRGILAAAQPAVLIALPQAHPPVAPGTAIMHPLGDAAPPSTGAAASPAHLPVDAAFIAFTSGSTGTPKGVICTHPALVNRLTWYAATYPAHENDVACLKTSPGFVDIYAELLGPLCMGIPVAIAPDDSAADPLALAALLHRHRVTRLVLVPTLLRALLDHADHQQLQHLRLCTCSGEPLDPALAQAFLNSLPACRLINIYGSSEVTADATYAEITPPFGARCDIGKPLSGVSVALVDAQGHAVPDGFPGEIALSGIALASGYLNDPQLSAQRFRPLPAFGGQRAFLSGDMAVQIPQGALMLLGRRDRQFKLEGIRIDALEIEAALLTLPGITHCRAVLDSRNQPPRLIAALAGTVRHDDSSLRARLQQRLPRAAIPRQFIWFKSLPAGPTGKVDDPQILAASAPGAAEGLPHPSGQTGEPARDEIERLLIEQWSALLACSIPHRHANFFELGGSSLKAIMAMNRLRTATGVAADARWLFETPELAALADRVRRALAGRAPAAASLAPPPAAAPAAQTATGDVVLAPLTFNQQWLIREYIAAPGHTAYNLAIAYRFDGATDIAALQQALQRLSDRHAALRTRLTLIDGKWMQQIQPAGSAAPVVLSRNALMNDQTARAYRDALAGTSFVLEGGTLFHIEVCSVDPHTLYLFMSAHHAMVDGWSGECLMRDLAQLYAAARGQAVPMADAPAGVAEIAAFQQSRVPALASQLDAYRDYVAAGAAPRCAWAGGGMQRGGPLARLPVTTMAHGRRPGHEGTTAFVLGLTALTVALHQFSTIQDRALLIGFPEAGRHEPAWENSAAFLANTVLGRFEVSALHTWPEAVSAVQQQFLQALSFRDIPGFWLQDLGWKGLDDTSDDLRVMIIPEQDFDWTPSLPGLEVTNLGPGAPPQTRVDLALTLKAGPQHSTCFELEYDSRRVPHPFASRLAQALGAYLELDRNDASGGQALALDWSKRCPALSALANAPSPAPIPGVDRLDQLVAQRALADPDRCLVIDAGHRLSASQLHTRAQTLARAMLDAHPAPGVIGLCMPRSADWLAALLAIWQTGASALVIDPEWPQDRIDFILRDSAADLLWPDGKALQHPAQAQPPRSGVRNAVAALVYTSGSSGRPKAVPVRHDALLRLGQTLADHYALTPASRILQAVAPAFDVALSDIAMSWYAGAALVTLPQHETLPGSTLNRTLDDWAITHLQVPAAVLEATPAQAHPTLAVLAVGGAICPAATLAAWAQDRRLFIVYGPTETTVSASLLAYGDPGRAGGLGRAIAGNRLAVVDPAGRALLQGMPGELLIAGPQVAGGYQGHAHTLSDAFGSTGLFGDVQPAYRSGDRVWMDEQGQCWLLGRLDRQFKIRGQRIDPEEIEITLQQHPAVRQAAVAARPAAPAPGGSQGGAGLHIIAWIVARDTPPSEEALRRWLQDRLPAAYLPARWVFITSLPLNPNGKIDWPALDVPPAATASAAAAPSTPVPATGAPHRFEDRADLIDFLASCWCELLEREEVEHDRSFFDYGGHSMLTVKLHERLQDATGLSLPIGEIFGHPTIDQMADYLLTQIKP